MERKYRVLLYPEGFNTKAKANGVIGQVKSTILNYPKEVSIKELGKALQKGCPVCLGHMEKTTEGHETCKKANWKSQQLFAVDIDNSEKKQKASSSLYLSIENALNKCAAEDIPPALIYETLSSTPDWERYRIIWILDKPAQDIEEFNAIMDAFAHIFSANDQTQIDESCKDLSRIFYGAKTMRLIAPDSIISKKKLLNIHKSVSKVHQATRKDIALRAEDCKELDLSLLPVRVKNFVEEIHSAIKGGKIRTGLERKLFQEIKDELLECDVLTKFGVAQTDFDRWPVRALQFETTKAAMDFLRYIPMDLLFFGEHVTANFHCFLHGEGHDMHSPSAHCYFNFEQDSPLPDGWFYKCFSCSKDIMFDIMGVLQILSQASCRAVARYLYLKFNIKCETPWQAEQKKDLECSEEFFHSEEFAAEFPKLHKRMLRGNLYGTYHLLVSQGRQSILDKERTHMEKPVFCLTTRQLIKAAPTYGIKKGRKSIISDIKMLARYGLIEILSDQDLSGQFAAILNQKRIKQESKYRIEVYSIPLMGADLAAKATKQIQADSEHGIKKRSFCKSAAMLDNKQLAKLSYSQYQNEKVPKKYMSFYQVYKKTALEALEARMYTCEKEIIDNLDLEQMKSILKIKTMGQLKKEIARCADVCLPHLLNDQEVDSCRIPFRKEYGIRLRTHNSPYRFRPGASRIIIKNSFFKEDSEKNGKSGNNPALTRSEEPSINPYILDCFDE